MKTLLLTLSLLAASVCFAFGVPIQTEPVPNPEPDLVSYLDEPTVICGPIFGDDTDDSDLH